METNYQALKDVYTGIDQFIDWSSSPQGSSYWSNVRDNLYLLCASYSGSGYFPGVTREDGLQKLVNLLPCAMDFANTAPGGNYWDDVVTQLRERLRTAQRERSREAING